MSDAISWTDFVQFVRQLSHDLRNQLNAAELQAALLNEMAGDAEITAETRRMREIVSRLGSTLQQLSSQLADPRAMLLPYSPGMFVTDLQKKIGQRFPDARIAWPENVSETECEMDPSLLQEAMIALFDNALRHNPGSDIALLAEMQGGSVSLTLREGPATNLDPENWKPLGAMSHGHYSLGLTRVRKIAAALGGTFTQTIDSGVLLSKLDLPCRQPARS
ncbi:MAG: hypothetical protein M3R59_03125 [Verrucomicrobiota bacterium]|nr:hypothetical protein [Verrucomicrobiota bacterium]